MANTLMYLWTTNKGQWLLNWEGFWGEVWEQWKRTIIGTERGIKQEVAQYMCKFIIPLMSLSQVT